MAGVGSARVVPCGLGTQTICPNRIDASPRCGRRFTTLVVDCLLRMAKRQRDENRIELVQGTLDMLILRTLQWGPQHGHGIGVAIRASSEDALQIDHGSLYPALHRLERQGWIDSDWKVSEKNQRAKYYRLTPAGRKQLAAEQSRWNRIVDVIARVMTGKTPAKGRA
jgi:PadR family transcriptional regulator PadR